MFDMILSYHLTGVQRPLGAAEINWEKSLKGGREGGNVRYCDLSLRVLIGGE